MSLGRRMKCNAASRSLRRQSGENGRKLLWTCGFENGVREGIVIFAMRHRLFRISLLVFVAIWFGVIVPGHRRGQITLAGCQTRCCESGSMPAGHSRHEPVPQPASCAICHFLATLDLPTPVQLHVPVLAFARPAEFLYHASLFSSDVRLTCFERGPPIG